MKKWEDILEKYWKGETSLEEEKSLREFMQKPDLPQAFRPYRHLFRYYEKSAQIAMPSPKTEKDFRQGMYKPIWGYILSVAAAVLLLLGLFLELNREDTSSDNARQISSQDTFEDPEQAYEEARNALLLVAEKMKVENNHKKNISKVSTLTAFFKTSDTEK